ncbi:N-acetyltransferase [Aeromicrobium flavum]|uniref:N-acetyltransferase n=1 Tax=Aeromicrobium flavum TaxID=416568 RepID=A0A512HRJ5_9ACTN|nr:GNAT family N-acetyltransferase [Aeromicrobium flavum]GEO88074.1 N-acetyltransferase [Aeromicrobium flavum]
MITLAPAASANWRDIARVRAADGQHEWVAETTYYLCLSAYDGLWRSYAILDGDATVGHVMWAVDPEDKGHWIGGLVIDAEHQGRGLGRATVEVLLDLWEREEPALSGTAYREAALSVSPDNEAAVGLYRSLGFVRTDEDMDDEIVMRRTRA